MANLSESIPANGILFHDAFALLFNAMRPDADALNATLNRLGQTALDRVITPEADEPEHQEFWDKWNAAHNEVEPILLEALRSGALMARRFSSRSGLELLVPLVHWQAVLVLSGEDLEYPPIYFQKQEFDAWLRRIQGNTPKRGRPPKARDSVTRAVEELFGGAPPKDMSFRSVLDEIILWHSNNNLGAPSDDTILRALGRRK